VLLETNWVVGQAAPAHHCVRAASELLERAARGELRLHVPAVCISEARKVLDQSRFRPRAEANALRAFMRWATEQDTLSDADADAARRVVDAMERKLEADRAQLPANLSALRSAPGIEVFGLTDAMLERSIQIAGEDVALKPFDQAILSAVLIRGAELASDELSEVCFVTLDADLQPWDKRGNARVPLKEWFDEAGIWVYQDFALTYPIRPGAPFE